MKRQHYTNEEKEKLLFRYASEQTDVRDMLQEAGIPKSTFNQWLREYDTKHNCQSENDYSPRNLRQLKARNLHLDDIIAVLNDSYCSPRASLRERLKEAERLQGSYNIHLVCEALGLSRSTFYNHIKRNHRDRAWFFLRREELKRQIRELFDDSSQIYGARKMAAVLRKRGVVVSTRLVLELMSEMGLISVRVYSNYLYSKEFGKYKNYLNQEFDVDAPNRIWVSDVTYFKYKENPYYICVVMDLFSRKVLSHCVGRSETTYLIKRTIRLAYEECQPENDLIFHSDRGAAYKSDAVRKYLASLEITQSFSRAYTPYDNAVIENFFGSLKKEELYRRRYRSEWELKECIKEFILFYNERRPHEKLNYQTPNEVEAAYIQSIMTEPDGSVC
ncbi:MAG: IS3 family transposase [Firmicutes bacterium]|nr:IS3 family transposase [Bacillota bacterium]